jgi:peptidoglycan/LPS O-acetylase OafA/YrhL
MPGQSTIHSHPAPPILWDTRFTMLDGWRGLAAAAVVIHHCGGIRLGHEAVIFFFVISGYCIAAAGESCVKHGWGTKRFMWRRIRRIYPPYLLSLLFFALTRLVRYLYTGVPFVHSTIEWIQNIFLVQWFTLIFDPKPTAASNYSLFVAAYWSLNYEEQFYIVTALLLGLGTVLRRRLIMLSVAAAAIWMVVAPRECRGIFFEYWAIFGIGVLTYYRLCQMTERKYRRLTDTGLLAVAIGSGILWALNPQTEDARPIWLEFCIASSFALILIISRPWDEVFKNSFFALILTPLGLISYSLYLIHQFNLTLVGSLVAKLLPEAKVPSDIIVGAKLILHICLATVFWYFCERPFLNRSSPERTARL